MPEIILAVSSCILIRHIIPDVLNSLRNKALVLNHNHCVYSTEEEAQRDLGIEKDKLGLNNLEIKVRFDDKNETAASKLTVGGPYEIILGTVRNRLGLGHELYHIYKHEKHGYTFWRWLFMPVEEWKATSYALQNHK